MDASFSQRRNAQNAFVPFMSSQLFLINHIEVGSQKSEKRGANELEAHLSKKGLYFLKENDFKVLKKQTHQFFF